MRSDPATFSRKPLRVHSFLAGVPLHDVWTFELRGGGEGRTLSDFRALVSADDLGGTNPMVAALFGLRRVLGRVFGWDRERPDDARSSYASRLTPDDRAASLQEAGTMDGPFRVLYAFENEGLVEIRNRTVHAFLCTAMEPTGDGYAVTWAVYVAAVSRLTPLYMALIDPFRRLLIYPAIVRRYERAWQRAYGRDALRPSAGS